jgi:glycosyltransferase involved in cell wall biosynthesis
MSDAHGGTRLAGKDARSGAVAVAAVGDPESPRTWSGTSAGILAGLRELGIAPRALDLSLPRGLEQALLATAAARTRNRYDAEGAALTLKTRSALAAWHLRRAPVRDVIQIGTTFSVPAGVGFVTLEDMTLRQAQIAHPTFSRMSAGAIARWERRRTEIYSRARMCAVASHWAAESLRRDYAIQPERVAVVGCGANHSSSAPERDWRSPRFLFVGIDWERKGGPQLLRAFSRLREAVPRAALDVVGGHPPLEQPGVTGHGVLSRDRDHDREITAHLFARATCFAMPSLIEPFGIAYVEAGSAGVPSIVSSVGGARDVIGTEGGIAVDPGDEEGLYRAMLHLSDPDAARRMGASARERAGLYTWRKVAERLLRALDVSGPDEQALAEFL